MRLRQNLCQQKISDNLAISVCETLCWPEISICILFSMPSLLVKCVKFPFFVCVQNNEAKPTAGVN